MLGGGKNGELDWNDLEAYNKQVMDLVSEHWFINLHRPMKNGMTKL